jgi:hypothetical protein
MEHHQKQQHHRNDIAFVLGNGKSRLNANLKALKEHGIIYGCNAIYREFDPDYLVAVDVKMINEIIDAGYHKRAEVWTNPNKGVKTKAKVNFFSPHKGWSSGPTALHFASTKGHKVIYILGFDYSGVNGKFNNVYADTFNYKKSDDSPTYHGNWLSQTEKTIKEFKNIKFFRVIEEGAFMPDQLGYQHANLKHINYKEFNSKFQATTI